MTFTTIDTMGYCLKKQKAELFEVKVMLAYLGTDEMETYNPIKLRYDQIMEFLGKLERRDPGRMEIKTRSGVQTVSWLHADDGPETVTDGGEHEQHSGKQTKYMTVQRRYRSYAFLRLSFKDFDLCSKARSHISKFDLTSISPVKSSLTEETQARITNLAHHDAVQDAMKKAIAYMTAIYPDAPLHLVESNLRCSSIDCGDIPEEPFKARRAQLEEAIDRANGGCVERDEPYAALEQEEIYFSVRVFCKFSYST